MATERENALKLLRQVDKKLDEAEQILDTLTQLQDQVDKERTRAISDAKGRAEAQSKQLLAEIGEANHEEQAKQKLHEERQKRAAKRMRVPKLLFLVYVAWAAFAIFQALQSNAPGHAFALIIGACLLLYAVGFWAWVSRKDEYVLVFNPKNEEHAYIGCSIILFWPVLIFFWPLWGIVEIPIILSIPLFTIIMIILAFCFFPKKTNNPSQKEASYLQNAVAKDKEILERQQAAEEASEKAVADAARAAERAFDSGARSKELEQEIQNAQTALRQSQKELAALDLHESYKDRYVVSQMIEFLEKGRVDGLKDAINMYEEQKDKKAESPSSSPAIDDKVDPAFRSHARNYIIVCAEALRDYDKPDPYVRRSVIIDGVNCGLAMPWAVIGLNPGFHTICVEYAESVGGRYYTGQTEVKSIRADDCTKIYSCTKKDYDRRLFTNPVYDVTELDQFLRTVHANRFDLLKLL